MSIDGDGLSVLQGHQTNAVGNLGANARQRHQHCLGICIGHHRQPPNPMATKVVLALVDYLLGGLVDELGSVPRASELI